MDKIYIISGDNIYYLENNVIIGIEWFTGTVHEGFVKHPTFVKPIYDSETETFIETATVEEIHEDKIKRANDINDYYASKISKLVGKHIEKFIIDDIAIPSEIINQRLVLINECNDAIQALGITEVTYKVSGPSK